MQTWQSQLLLYVYKWQKFHKKLKGFGPIIIFKIYVAHTSHITVTLKKTREINKRLLISVLALIKLHLLDELQ